MATVTVERTLPAQPPPIEKVTLELSYDEASYLVAVLRSYTPIQNLYDPSVPRPWVGEVIGIYQAIRNAGVGPGGSYRHE